MQAISALPGFVQPRCFARSIYGKGLESENFFFSMEKDANKKFS